ncbi:MAG: 16S rRNA (cytosine(1402)-N(4))-methyltransferase RsmH [Candidatus Methylacidiphilales bacterium]|nr:16S rRNA (cytosine(1402)-N(4))-methyltransferase RsmH [Candidatus Methylacidiphilales bacterium]
MEHRPVLLNEVVEALKPAPGLRMLDGTFGRGGHSRALLAAGATVVALDRDPAAHDSPVAHVLRSEFGTRFVLEMNNFDQLEQVAGRQGPFDGILLDLGVSSPQLDEAERGFSFLHDGPLDMRMDPTRGDTAADRVNQLDEQTLARLLFEYGDEPQARGIARAIVRRREKSPFLRTTDLAGVIAQAVGGRRDRKTHPATKSFQALRISVNDEMGALDRALAAMPNALAVGGRMAVISFHSLEDRRVKQFIESHSQEELRGPASPFGQPNPEYCLRKIGRHLPSEEEVAQNPRARSARLRVAERI